MGVVFKVSYCWYFLLICNYNLIHLIYLNFMTMSIISLIDGFRYLICFYINDRRISPNFWLYLCPFKIQLFFIKNFLLFLNNLVKFSKDLKIIKNLKILKNYTAPKSQQSIIITLRFQTFYLKVIGS